MPRVCIHTWLGTLENTTRKEKLHTFEMFWLPTFTDQGRNPKGRWHPVHGCWRGRQLGNTATYERFCHKDCPRRVYVEWAANETDLLVCIDDEGVQHSKEVRHRNRDLSGGFMQQRRIGVAACTGTRI
jgi:hypothetical protein